MSDIMRAIPFAELLTHSLREYREKKELYAVPVADVPVNAKMTVAERPLSCPIGPAAGPHTQLAQNLIAGFGAGARVFELKTVQILYGEQLGIQKPCIWTGDEAYNIEWSTELTIAGARDEYIRAYIVMHLLAKEFGLDADFQFHASVGYNLEGIQSPTVDGFLNAMHDASQIEAWKEAIDWTLAHLDLFEHVDADFVRSIDPCIAKVITLSTMHGCPADEIERIATYLLTEKGFHTYIKCNPTLIGYEGVKSLLDELGYGYIAFDTTHFDHDLKLDDALAMLRRLRETAAAHGRIFGVKLTNTFPVQIKRGELAGDAMYMSGKPLFPLAIGVARILSEAFDGELPISFSGGIDLHNVTEVLACGIAPVTVATLLLKAGGYKNLTKLAKAMPETIPTKVDVKRLAALCDSIPGDDYYHKKADRPRPAHPDDFPPACFKCKNCVDVCPNRANYPIPELKMAIHIDAYCNECGNCACLCPFGIIPYRDKFTLFSCEEDFVNSTNDGFLGREKYRWHGEVGTDFVNLPEELRKAIDAVLG